MSFTLLDKCRACGYPVVVEMCRGLESCDAAPGVLFGPNGPMQDESLHSVFADDAIDALQKELDEALDALRVMRAQRDDWQGQAAALKKEVSALRRTLRNKT